MFEKTEKAEMTVEGMMCNHCVMHVKEALKALKGVKKFDVCLETKTVTVEFIPGKITIDEILGAISAAGYTPKIK